MRSVIVANIPCGTRPSFSHRSASDPPSIYSSATATCPLSAQWYAPWNRMRPATSGIWQSALISFISWCRFSRSRIEIFFTATNSDLPYQNAFCTTPLAPLPSVSMNMTSRSLS